MGVVFRFTRILVIIAAASLAVGCAQTEKVSVSRILRHQAMLDFSGLKDPQTVATVKSRIAPPETWEQLVPKKSALFTDVQFRAPSRMTGVGVCYVRMPLPLSARMLGWLAKKEYTKKEQGGRLIGEWTDEIGRPWFEAENNNYHVRGFIVTKGFEAWITYAGYKTQAPPNTSELALALRSIQTAVPVPNLQPSDTTTSASTSQAKAQ
jgi:hypothetical protein